MSSSSTINPSPQLEMPGMPVTCGLRTVPSARNVAQGQKVLYLGKISGGPRFGARGTVVRTLRNNALVDLGKVGTWRVPYYFLALPEAA